MKRIGLASRWNKGASVCTVFLLMFALCCCAKTEVPESVLATEVSQSTISGELVVERNLTLTINGQSVSVEWEDNESVEALKDYIKDKALTIQMSMYGGFEQVGSLGTSLPRNDNQTTTAAGDIVLYSGNQIVVFYGSNSWAYTRLGHITDKNESEMSELLGNGNVTIEISLA